MLHVKKKKKLTCVFKMAILQIIDTFYEWNQLSLSLLSLSFGSRAETHISSDGSPFLCVLGLNQHNNEVNTKTAHVSDS